MSKRLHFHNYADIIDAGRSPSPMEALPVPRSHMSIKYTTYARGFGDRVVNRMPFEVLHQIFQFYFDLCPIVHRPGDGPLRPGIYTSVSQQLNPFTLAHVCAYWRSVISSIPSFWSSICIVGPLHKQAYAVSAWLDRARPLPTNIRLIQLDVRCALNELKDATNQVLSALIQHSSHWQRLRLEFRCIEYQWALSRIDPQHLQCLEDVHLELPPWTVPRPELNRIWSLLYQAPTLRRVSWNTVNFPPPFHLSGWQNLTTVDCGSRITQYDIWSLLWASPNLHTLRARGVFNKDPAQSLELRPVTCKRLRVLDLEFDSSPAAFYQNVTFPNLTSLRVLHKPSCLAVDPAIQPLLIWGVFSRLLRSISNYSKFKTLIILDSLLPQTILLRGIFLIKQLRNVTYLGLNYVTQDIISSLILRPAPHPSILPHLRELEIFNRYGEGLRMDESVQREEKQRVHSCCEELLKSRPPPFIIYLNPSDEVLSR